MKAKAILLEEPGQARLSDLVLGDPTPADIVVDMEWSGISTGTERLLWSGKMPSFPGMGYPLVPGYESVGRVVEAGPLSGRKVGERVFVPGANCYRDARGLFGGASSRVVIPGAKAMPVDGALERQAVLLALAATAHHAVSPDTRKGPELIVGHGVLGRLVARLVVAGGGRPTVWERDPRRRTGAAGYDVVDPDADERRDYARVCDASGDPDILDALVSRLARGGEIVLAGFYSRRLSFAFPPAFMREASIRVAAEWRRNDLVAVAEMAADGRLSLDGLVTHEAAPSAHADAYATAFGDPGCLKMVLDWRPLAWTH
ncbi:chlorophyll synthesis pathway protein BchC [Aureimonas leprariae]|uniref:Chlorophyll synthesis pathway protein BchC n=1 Tax=Plantimonas leprariae TaxID=2615207 RepID=A0A7V7PQB2_9HYPH|nr:chlorophyll synthesis pathway protein BchC [Aureimonas leprariae]KAB0680317.1 chlorophyll synthesis pathway protein BchC [Aureimonas leprariae]